MASLPSSEELVQLIQQTVTSNLQQFAQQMIQPLQQQMNELRQERVDPSSSSLSSSSSLPSDPQLIPPSRLLSSSLASALKPNKPSVFEGGVNSGTMVESFVYELNSYFTCIEMTTGGRMNDTAKIQVAITYLRKDAIDWWKMTVRSTGMNITWDEFQQLLLNHYRPANATMNARARLYACKQEKRTVRQYNIEFMKYLNQISGKMELEDQMLIYTQGLQGHLQREVIIQQPKNLNECMVYADRAEMTARTFRPRMRNYDNDMPFPSGSLPYPARNYYSGNQPSQTVPMEVNVMNQQQTVTTHGTNETEHSQDETRDLQMNAMNGSSNGNRTGNMNNGRMNRMTEAERTQCMQQGLCFLCRGKGHRVRECPKNGQGQRA